MSNFPTFGGTGTGIDGTDGTNGTDGVDGAVLQFASVADRDTFFTGRPDLLKLNLPINVFMGGDTVTIQVWKGATNPASYDPITQAVFWVAGSVRTGTSSLELGEIHTISSGGENVFFTNSVTDLAYFPPWQSVGDHSTVEGQVVQNIPTHRVYGDLEVVEPRGAVVSTGSVDYNVVDTVTRNEAVFGLRFVPSENYTGQYEYRITETATGIVVFSQIRSGVVLLDQDLIFWFDFPVESFLGREVRAEILKEDGTYGQSRPSANDNAEPYIEIRTREFTDVPLASSTDVVQSDWDETDTNSNAFILNKPTIGATLDTEAVQDIVGAMVSSNTETGISVTYDDTNGKLNFVIGTTPADGASALYFGLSDSNNPATINLADLTLVDPSDPQTVETGVTTAGQYFIMLTPVTHDFTSITDTVLNQEVKDVFTRTADVREISGTQFISYVVGALNAGVDEEYVVRY